MISDRVAMQWNEQISNFFVQGRHVNVTVFITSQHVKGIGPLLRKNLDFAVMMPIFDLDARTELHKMYNCNLDKQTFFQVMDEVVLDEELPDSTPQEPNKRVRIMIVKEFVNAPNPSMKICWCEAEDPGKFRMLHPDYWKEQDNNLGVQLAHPRKPIDIVAELDSVQDLQNLDLHDDF